MVCNAIERQNSISSYYYAKFDYVPSQFMSQKGLLKIFLGIQMWSNIWHPRDKQRIHNCFSTSIGFEQKEPKVPSYISDGTYTTLSRKDCKKPVHGKHS